MLFRKRISIKYVYFKEKKRLLVLSILSNATIIVIDIYNYLVDFPTTGTFGYFSQMVGRSALQTASTHMAFVAKV